MPGPLPEKVIDHLLLTDKFINFRSNCSTACGHYWSGCMYNYIHPDSLLQQIAERVGSGDLADACDAIIPPHLLRRWQCRYSTGGGRLPSPSNAKPSSSRETHQFTTAFSDHQQNPRHSQALWVNSPRGTDKAQRRQLVTRKIERAAIDEGRSCSYALFNGQLSMRMCEHIIPYTRFDYLWTVVIAWKREAIILYAPLDLHHGTCLLIDVVTACSELYGIS